MALALFLAVTPTFHGNVTSVGLTSSDYYLSGIVVSTDKVAYVCGDTVEASAALYSDNLTIPKFPVSLQITSPSGSVLISDSELSDSYGVARLSLLLSTGCEVGIYTIAATSPGRYNSVSAEDKFSVNTNNDYVTINFDKLWYHNDDSVVITGRLITNCSLTLTSNQVTQVNLYGPDNGTLASATTATTGSRFTLAFKLPGSSPSGLYQLVTYGVDPCRNKPIYGNAFFSVVSNISTEPWGISVTSDKSTYGTGDHIVVTGAVTGGPYFFCQLGWACSPNHTFSPITASIHILDANGSQIYSRTVNSSLDYYPPSYAFQEVFSGYVSNSYLMPGKYLIIAEAHTDGYPTVQTATSFTVVPSAGDYSLSAASSTLSMMTPSSSTVALAIQPVGGFNSEVDLSISWVGKEPINVTTDLEPEMGSTGSSWVSVLTISAGPSAPTGTYNLTVTATARSNPNLSHSVEVQVHFVGFYTETGTRMVSAFRSHHLGSIAEAGDSSWLKTSTPVGRQHGL